MATATVRTASTRLSQHSSKASPTLTYLHGRTLQAQRQAKRRRIREEVREAKRERWNLRREESARNAELRQLLRAERTARREDWEMGPLAPNRDVRWSERAISKPRGKSSLGLVIDKPPHGAIPGMLSRNIDIPRSERRKDWGIGPGDRVVVVGRDHREQGKIGKVLEVREASQEVTLERVNMANIAIPPYQLRQEQDKTPFRAMPVPIPLRDVRLVVALVDQDSGSVQDEIVDEMRIQKVTWRNGVQIPKRRFVRMPGGDEVEIPYPEDLEAAERRPEYDIDTLRIEVEERSWTPTLSVPPMPPSIIDELRNKYSKFRTRHDVQWIAARDRIALHKEARIKSMQQKMITPLEELQRAKQAEKLAQGGPQLDEDMLARLGAVMARSLGFKETEPRDQKVG